MDLGDRVSDGERPLLAGRYVLLDILGEGGLGTVWRARDQLAQREVALKQLRAEYMLDPRLRRRLRREARAVARLEHPNIVRLYDMGEDADGSPFLAMEMARGPSLHTVVQREDMGLEQIVDFVDQILSALAYAHARGVIHRDIKPDNLIVTQADDGGELLKLLDFGFARVENDSDDQLTNVARDVFGTPTYMAPEQATGEFEVSAATDLYALGIVFWELLCGEPPFTGATGTQVVVKHVTEPLPPFVPLQRFDLPEGVGEFVTKALEKEPSNRYASAGEMRRLLNNLFEDFDDQDDMTVVSMVPGLLAQLTEPEGELAEPSVFFEPMLASQSSLPNAILGETAPLVGRDQIQRWLWSQVVKVCRHDEQLTILLEGPVGIGKTRLLQWLRESLAEGGWMTTIGGRFRAGCLTGGLRQAVRTALGIGARASEVTVETIRTALADLTTPGAIDAETVAAWLWPSEVGCPVGKVHRALEQIVRALAARMPVLLWLDELDSATDDDIATIEHLVRRLTESPAPVLLIAAVQTDEAGTILATKMRPRIDAFVQRLQGVIAVRPVPSISKGAAQALVDHFVVLDPNFGNNLILKAMGNPLYIVRALQYLRATDSLVSQPSGYFTLNRPPPCPSGLVDLTRAQLDVTLKGEDELRPLVERLALLGEVFPLGLIEQITAVFGESSVSVEAGIDRLVRLGILVDESQDAFAFQHNLVREAIVDSIHRRADTTELHRGVADAKERWYGIDMGTATVEIARHRRLAGGLIKAVECMLRAGQHARDAYQYTTAQSIYGETERWLAEAGAQHDRLRAELLAALSELSLERGDLRKAVHLATQLEKWAKKTKDHRQLGRALRIQGEVLLSANQNAKAGKVLAEAARRFEAIDDPIGRAQVALARGRLAVRLREFAVARGLFTAANTEFGRAGRMAGQARCRYAIGELAIEGGDRATGMQRLAESIRMAEASGELVLQARAALRLADLHRQARQIGPAARRFQEATNAYEATGNQAGSARALRGLADAQRMLHRPEAAESYRRAADLFESQDDFFQLAVCFTQMGRMAAEAGQLDEAEASFNRALGYMDHFDDPQRVGILNAFLARVAHRRGDSAAREYRLDIARRIDQQRPLIVGEWARVLEEIAGELPASQSKPLLIRASEVWEALKQPTHVARIRATLEGQAGWLE